MKKKTLSLALALVMCLGLIIPVQAQVLSDGVLEVYLTGVLFEEELEVSFVYPDDPTANETKQIHLYHLSPDAKIQILNAGPDGRGSDAIDCWDLKADGNAYTATYVTGEADPLYEHDSYEILDSYDLVTDGSLVEEYFDVYAEGDGNADLNTVRIYYIVSDKPLAGGQAPDTDPQPVDPKPTTPSAEVKTANPTNDKLEVNGVAVDPTVYKIDGSNYFKIRDVAAVLNGTEKQFAVGYDGEKNAVTATTGQGYDKQAGDLAGAPSGGSQSAAASNDAIYVNGEKITAEVYKIGGSNYFKLRDLGEALNFYVGWEAGRGVYIETDKPYSK